MAAGWDDEGCESFEGVECCAGEVLELGAGADDEAVDVFGLAKLLGLGESVGVDVVGECFVHGVIVVRCWGVVGGSRMVGMKNDGSGCMSLVRLVAPGSMCSGVVVAADMVLTAKHFLQNKVPREVVVRGEGFSCGVSGWIDIAGTDVSVVRLAEVVDVALVVPVSARVVRVGMQVVSFGFGNSSEPKYGVVVARLPFAFSQTLGNRVRHAVVVSQRNPAVRGDSGGPVFVAGELVGLQSMITDPFGYNLGFATVAVLAPYVGAIAVAMNRLR